MRLASCLLAFAVLATPFVSSSAPAAAQQSTNQPPCNGSINVVRISDIKPGKIQTFLDAVAAQKAWYKKAGVSDEIAVMRILDRDSATKAESWSTTQAITTHIQPADRAKAPAHDAGFDAFVALFTESSTIKTQYVTCMTK